jgi:hypothetical protein
VEIISAVVAAVLTSSVVAAVVAGYFGDRNERRKQLRDQRIALAGEFAGDAMAALATLRDIKPTRGTAHRNEKLHHNATLREERIAAAQHAVDRLRPLRGRVWVLFPGRSAPNAAPSTTADWAEYVVGRLRGTEVVCHQFWAECEALTMVEGTQSRDLSSREELEKKYDAEYDRWRGDTWRVVTEFTDSAAKRIDAR